MKTLFLLVFLLPALNAFADDPLPGFHNDSEAGIVDVAGNSRSETYNLQQNDSYAFGKNAFLFGSKYLKTSSDGVDSALNWHLTIRYERVIFPLVSLYVDEAVESDRFSGFEQRYISDVGGKYSLYKLPDFYWNAELGYRYTIENRTDGTEAHESYIRIYSEANKDWTKTFSSKLWVDYLPNITDSHDYQLNSEISVSAAINTVFSIKTGYLVKYRNELVGGALKHSDTQFTTALVAKF